MKVFFKNALMFRLKRLDVLMQTIRRFLSNKTVCIHLVTFGKLIDCQLIKVPNRDSVTSRTTIRHSKPLIINAYDVSEEVMQGLFKIEI